VNIILCGFKSSGKTVIGRECSRILKRTFLDVDDLCEEDYLKYMGRPRTCREIFLAHGKDFFREIERRAISNLKVKNTIIASGAGAVLDARNVAQFKEKGRLIFLKTEHKILKERILNGPLPAYLDEKSPEESFHQMLLERSNIYEQVADIILDVSSQSITEAAETLSITVQKITRSYVQ
jgi:shikimate kinase